MGIEEMVIDRAKKIGLKMGMEKGIEKGVEKGMQKASTVVVKNLLLANRFTIAEIANFANVTEQFVEKIKTSLQ